MSTIMSGAVAGDVSSAFTRVTFPISRPAARNCPGDCDAESLLFRVLQPPGFETLPIVNRRGTRVAAEFRRIFVVGTARVLLFAVILVGRIFIIALALAATIGRLTKKVGRRDSDQSKSARTIA